MTPRRHRHSRHAVILAAGRGMRLGAVGERLPKGLIRLGRLPIIEESIMKLLGCGIEDVVVVVGHHAESFRYLATTYAGHVTLVHNERFATSGSLYSFVLAAQDIKDDFVLIDSDLVYERRALEQLLGFPGSSATVVSGFSLSGDEYFVDADERGVLRQLTRTMDAPGTHIIGEMPGITRISPDLRSQMLAFASDLLPDHPMLEYWDALLHAGRSVDIHCVVIDDLIWGEIDDAAQLERVDRDVYPRIVALDAAIAAVDVREK